MHATLLVLVFILGISAYVSAVYQMLRGQYSPSFFSRGVWFLLGINSLAGVYLGDGSQASVILATTLFLGNTAVFITSYKKGSREFGTAERISLGLLIISGILWAVLEQPFVGLILGLVAHFVGGVPTIWRTVKRPESEQAYHWYFFFLASVLSVIASQDKHITVILFPVYFIFFEGLILVLVNRRKIRQPWLRHDTANKA